MPSKKTDSRHKSKSKKGHNKKSEIRKLQNELLKKNKTIRGLRYALVSTVRYSPLACSLEAPLPKVAEKLDEKIATLVDKTTTFNSNSFKCPICFDDYDTEKCWPLALNCGHLLCKHCLLEMKESVACDSLSCPICRGAAPLENALPLYFP